MGIGSLLKNRRDLSRFLAPASLMRNQRPKWTVATFIAVTLLSLVSVPQISSAAQNSLVGPFGPEGPRMREQFWMLPSGEDGRFLRATVFRPDEPDGAQAAPAKPRPLVVINHGTAESTRMAVSMPVYFWLSRWFVDRGYIVVLPQRRGHGATGGTLSEGVGNCANPDHYQSGLVAADDIAAVVNYFQGQSGVDASDVTVAGISTGGWASLAYASRNPKGVRAVVNFSGGRGGHAGGMPNAVCGEKRLVESARRYGESARIPTLWFYSNNDSYFGPDLARSMAKAWNAGGGRAELHVLGAYGEEGHNIADDRAGWELWGRDLAGFLTSTGDPMSAKVAEVPARAAGEAPQASRAAYSPTNGGTLVSGQ
jgi:pimeloyl-ACP methyl ester carboxylesterase